MNALFDAVIRASIENRVVVLLAACAVVALGAWQLCEARLDALPSFTPPIVTVQAEAPGYGSLEVEQLVTAPLEQGLVGIPGVTRVRSTSSSGLAVVGLTFAEGTEIFRARQLVSEELQRAATELPSTLPPPQLGPIVSPVGALFKFTYTVDDDDDETFRQLSNFVQWRVVPRLRAIDGVARVTVHGAASPRVEVRLDPARMVAFGLGLSELRGALATARGHSSPGYDRAGAQRVSLRADTRWSLDDLAQIGSTVVARREEVPIRVSDLGQVRLGHVPEVGVAFEDGQRAVYVQVDKLPWVDTLELSARVEHDLAELDGSTPRNCHRRAPVFRQADFIHTSLMSVGRAMLLGSLIVTLILLLFLRSPRVASISLVALPLSMLTALLVLLLVGATINAMVLGGLAIAVGEVVDDAIVDVENIWRRLKDNASLGHPRSTLQVIHDASVEVRGAVVYASLIVVVVLVPVVSLGGLAGRIFSPLAEAYALAIVASLLVALIVTPALSAVLLVHRSGDDPESALSRKADHLYGRILTLVQRRPGTTLVATLAVAAVSLSGTFFLGGGFLPEFREGVLITEIEAWPGTSLEETTRLALRAGTILRGGGQVSHVAARVGRATMDDDAAPVHRVEMDLELPPDSGEPEEVAAEILEQLATLPGIRFTVDGFLGERINDLLAGERAPIVIKLRGPDLEVLRTTASKLRAPIAALPGVDGARSRNLLDVPTKEILPDRSALSLLGASPAQVVDAIAASRQGLAVAEVSGPTGFRVPMVIRVDGASGARGPLSDLPIWTSNRSLSPLSALASIREGSEPAAIQHEGGQRMVSIAVEARQSELTSVAEGVEAEMKRARLPPGVTWELAGQAAERRRASVRLAVVALAVLAAIFAFLWMAFHSLTDALVVVVGIPVGLAGGVAAAFLLPDGVSLAALIGFITLTGIISRNGIMLVSHKNQLLATHPGDDPRPLIKRAAQERLRPVLMTAATALGGLLPLALSLDAAGSELEAPMALIVCGGLLTSTVLNLLAVPAFYLWRLRSTRHGGPRRAAQEVSP